MFNPNGTFKWSVDLATMIYSNPEANTTWEYIYPQICKYLEDRGKTCSLQELGDKRIMYILTRLEPRAETTDTILYYCGGKGTK